MQFLGIMVSLRLLWNYFHGVISVFKDFLIVPVTKGWMPNSWIWCSWLFIILSHPNCLILIAIIPQHTPASHQDASLPPKITMLILNSKTLLRATSLCHGCPFLFHALIPILPAESRSILQLKASSWSSHLRSGWDPPFSPGPFSTVQAHAFFPVSFGQ